MPTPRIMRFFVASASALFLSLSPTVLSADPFMQINLVSNIPGFAAVTDPNLINPWGLSHSATSPNWISDQGTGLSTLYSGTGAPTALVVTIPGGTGDNAGPTGQVFNSSAAGFVLSDSAKATFLFANLNGTISGWNGGAGTTALNAITTPGASYTGLALATDATNASYLYAADVNHGIVHVFNATFGEVTNTTFAGKFVDATIPVGFVPYNVQLIGSSIYVVYATFDALGNEQPGGFVDSYDLAGNFIKRIASGSPLDGPWGIALAPSTFGAFANDFLIGNVADGEITAYDQSGLYLGTLNGPDGKPFVDDSIWALDFRTGGGASPNALYLTAGINGEEDGLFAEIVPTPEPASVLLTGLGLFALVLIQARVRCQALKPL